MSETQADELIDNLTGELEQDQLDSVSDFLPLPPQNIIKLNSPWTLWVSSTLDTPSSSITPISDFQTLEEFWMLINTLKSPNDIKDRCDIIFMRNIITQNKEASTDTNLLTEDTTDLEDDLNLNDEITYSLQRIKPEWEFLENRDGGEHRYSFTNHDDKELLWLHTLLSVLCDTFEEAKTVNGVWLSIRQTRSRLSLWQAKALTAPLSEAFETLIKGVTKSNSHNLVTFLSHASQIETVNKSRPGQKNARAKIPK